MPDIEKWGGMPEHRTWRDFFAPLLFSEPGLGLSAGREGVQIPSIDVYETETEVVVKAEVPGIKPGDMDIMVYPDRATISARMDERSEERGVNFHKRERRTGSFLRTVNLPAEVDTEGAKATFDHGLLEIRVPKVDDPKKRGRRLRLEANKHHYPA